MKFSLWYQQPNDYLMKADEIKVRNCNQIMDIEESLGVDNIQNKRFNVLLLADDKKDWDYIDMCANKYNTIFCVDTLSMLRECASKGYKAYLGYAVDSFQTLRLLKSMGAEEVILDTPLIFEMDKVKSAWGGNVRLKPCAGNKFGFGYFDYEFANSFVRPEDLELFEDYVSIVDFDVVGLTSTDQERALYRIYAEEHHWPGNISYLVNFKKYDCCNRLLVDGFTKHRMNCGARCLEDSSCHYCERSFAIAQETFMRQAKELIEQQGKVENN